MIHFKKMAALLCGMACLCSVTGCKEKNTVEPAKKVYTTTVLSRETIPGNVGEMSEIGNVEVTVDKLYRSEYYGSQDGVLTNIIFLEVTITNNSDEPVDVNMLTSFEFDVDGAPADTATLQAISSAQKQFGEDCIITEAIEVGKTVQGCIPAEVSNNFKEITLNCLPLGGADENYDISKAITYTFKEEDFEEIKMPPAQDDTETKTQTQTQTEAEAAQE